MTRYRSIDTDNSIIYRVREKQNLHHVTGKWYGSNVSDFVKGKFNQNEKEVEMKPLKRLMEKKTYIFQCKNVYSRIMKFWYTVESIQFVLHVSHHIDICEVTYWGNNCKLILPCKRHTSLTTNCNSNSRDRQEFWIIDEDCSS